MKSTNKTLLHHENYIIELFKTIIPYKWSILLLTIVFILLAKVYLYFTPPVYESYAIIKIKENEEIRPNQDPFQNRLTISTAGINQEMAILQTFNTNQQALKKVDFTVQYFIKEQYKQKELYKELPIVLKNVSNIHPKYIGKKITLTPYENGFTLNSEKIKSNKIYPYDSNISSYYFQARVEKKLDFSEPIILKVNGDERTIYEKYITTHLSVNKIDEETQLIEVSFQDTIPQRATDYINALIEAYINLSIERKNRKNGKILTFLAEQLELTRIKLELSETELEKYQSNHSNVNPTVKFDDSFKKLSNLDLELSEIRLKKKLIQNISNFIKTNKNLDSIAPALIEFNDQATIRLIDKLQNYQAELDTLLSEFTEMYPQVIQLRRQIKKTKYKISFNIKNLKSTFVLKEKSLLKQKKKYENILKTLPKKEKQLIHFKRDYELNSKLYTYLLEKKSENELLKLTAVADYDIIDSAYASTTPVKPRPLLFLVVGALLGLAIGAFQALLRSFTLDKIEKTQDIELHSNLPIYGVIPLFKESFIVDTSIKEAYFKIATNIQFSKKENIAQIVLITSAIEEEGKTTTIANLASAFQHTSYSSIVVDLNLNHPALHHSFGLETQHSGISTYLNKRDNLGNIIFSTNHDNLDIIPVGPTPPNPSELILSSKLDELFKILKERYDYIFIDTNGYELSPDAFYLMKYSDINLIVLRENISKKSSLKDLEKLIEEHHIKNIGLIVKSMQLTKPKERKNALPSIPEREESNNTPQLMDMIKSDTKKNNNTHIMLS